MTVSRIHKSVELVQMLCSAWADDRTAKVQASIITRELCRMGLLVHAEVLGLVVIEATMVAEPKGQPPNQGSSVMAPINRDLAAAAIRTLQAKGYSWTGGTHWRPPIGQPPDNLDDVGFGPS